MPRVTLGATAIQRFRANPNNPVPYLIYSPDHYSFFSAASIKVCVVLLGTATECLCSRDASPVDATWSTVPITYAGWWQAYHHNWWSLFWLGIEKQKMPAISGCVPLSNSQFVIGQGMTTDDFYKIEIYDEQQGNDLKLITSGLIDPQISKWGSEAARFRGKRLQYPRIVNKAYSTSLDKRLQNAKRPKILIANLTREFECFLDHRGEYQGATATFNIFHQQDDMEALRTLCGLLLQAKTSKLFRIVLGYNAMHSSITVEKWFLENFPIPIGLSQ